MIRRGLPLLGPACVAGYLLTAVLAPLLIPAGRLDPVRATGPPLAPPSYRFPLGTDSAGRSVLELTLCGSRWSLLIGVTATVLAVGLGAAIALASGHFGGPGGAVLDRAVEWFVILPQLPFAVALGGVLAPGALPVLLAIAVTSWAGVARVVRAAVLAVEAEPYLERVRALGAGHVHQLRHHVLPAVRPVVLATASLTLANAVLTETTLSFLGLGDPTRVSWGSVLHDAAVTGAVTAGAWWCLLPPGLALIVLVLGFEASARLIGSIPDGRVR